MKIPLHLTLLSLSLFVVGGCEEPARIESYVISTEVPTEFLPQKQRMLGAIFPKGDQVWFFKVMGPEPAIAGVAETFRQFVETIPYNEDGPLLTSLPDGWRRAADKPMRFASVSVETPQKQLDISISALSLQENWEEQVIANVNRWRGQLALSNSTKPLAGAENFDVKASDGDGVWVDLTGDVSESASSTMVPPFASSSRNAPAATLSQSASQKPQIASNDDPRLEYKRPEGWRDGRASSMRLASFDVGPEGATAEMTVIIAGGDLRGNVKRWLGQISDVDVSDELVDKALEDAQQFEVDGLDAQRFILRGDSSDSEKQMIDATIIPVGEEQSVFIKMTGPPETVDSQRAEVQTFLESLQFSL